MIIFECPTCGEKRSVEVSDSTPLFPPCCFTVLLEGAHQTGAAVMHQMFLQFKQKQEEDQRILDKVADAAIISPDPEVRAAALKYRRNRHHGD